MSKAAASSLVASLSMACLILPAQALADRYSTTQHDFGGVGLLQTPTARMAPVGEFSFNANRTSPYSRYSVSVQPFSWLEGTIRYMAISNREYAVSTTGQSYKDKAVDVKVRLLQENYWLPDVAFGMRDVGGTGLFASEYFVANKRFYDLDFSLGFAWGYIGNRGDVTNPLAILGGNFNERPGRTSDQVGDFNQDAYFKGRPGIFGGVEYQTPWEPLRLKLELDGNDYQSEPQENNQAQDSPINIGAVYKYSDGISFTAGWERGNTAMIGITLRTNLSDALTPKTLDPEVEPRQALPAGVSAKTIDWANVSDRLRENAGFEVETIEEKNGELIVTGEQKVFRNEAQGLGRASRILDNSAGEGTYDWYTLVNKPRGMAVTETSIDAGKLRDLRDNRIDDAEMRRSVVNATPSVLNTELLHTEPLDKFTYGVSLGYNQNVGGPDGFILYQFLARLTSEYRFSRNQWIHTSVAANLLDNFDKFRYDAPSQLPRVRTNIREYLTSSDVVIESLQYTHTKRLDRDLYASAYAGMLESMFGGVGGELLFRPHNDNWAVGVDVNWVRQRGFKQDLSFRDYSTLTGHVTGYVQTSFYDVLAKGSVGRYLAGDYGATLDLSRRYKNGISVGAWVTRTNVSAEEFGEGSFDKGVYFSFPFDAFFARSSKSSGTIAWNPLTRDGGARLARRYQLYDMTRSADMSRFNDGYDSLRD
ncbi:YjbH domain-containing protein [Halopseudomonas salina]|uniref:Membrane protein n=1 Tax=Halopseudomonas salina TaxID=1323744 RepID=A0ABQ1PHR4_9GAMM|nr:YjbH domain-containing protein [Halopseudomonas salina]GGC97443.1 membrane protein [Halopseudomonas salina]